MTRIVPTRTIQVLLLAFVCGGSTAIHAQGCAVDAPDAEIITGFPVHFLGVETLHHYQDGMPIVLVPADQKFFYVTQTAVLTTTPDLPGTSPQSGAIGSPLADAIYEKIDPNPINKLSVLASQINGDVSRLVENGATIWSSDLGRGGSCTSDRTGELTVQLKDLSTSNFQSIYTNDLIYVGTTYTTATGCTTGHNTDNKLFAIDASSGSILWVFNEYGTYDVDQVHGMAVDKTLSSAAPNPLYGLSAYQEDRFQERLYVTTERTGPSGQHSVWSLNVLTGVPVWSVDAGRIQTNPVVRGGRLYVTTVSGDIKALEKSDGSEIWSHSTFLPFLKDFVVGRQPPYDNLIVLVNYFGDVLLVQDNGGSATVLWTTDLDSGGGEQATTAPFFDDAHGYIYVGASDGKLYQLDVETGAVGPTRTVDVGGDDVVQLIRYAPAVGDSKPYTNTLFAATDTTNIARFCTPFMYPPGTLVADGDINNDGFVNAIDILLATKAVLGHKLLDPTEFGHGDVAPVISSVPNPNGTFDLGDLLMISRKALFGSF